MTVVEASALGQVVAVAAQAVAMSLAIAHQMVLAVVAAPRVNALVGGKNLSERPKGL